MTAALSAQLNFEMCAWHSHYALTGVIVQQQCLHFQHVALCPNVNKSSDVKSLIVMADVCVQVCPPLVVIVQVAWLPGSTVQLAIAAQQQVFVYDLSASAVIPQVMVKLPETESRLTAFTVFCDMSPPADPAQVGCCKSFTCSTIHICPFTFTSFMSTPICSFTSILLTEIQLAECY